MLAAQRCLLVLVLFGTCFTGDSWAQDYRSVVKTRTRIVNRGGHCHRCQKESSQCNCAQPIQSAPMITQPIISNCPVIQPAPMMVPQTTMRPVYETQYRPQQVVTNRTVVETQYRSEAYAETVPVQTMKQITVDEGQWQQVWVAKPVTKQIAETTYQQRMACRTVPQQVTRVVPQVSTTMVPYQTVRYVAQQTCVPTCDPGTGTTMNITPAMSAYSFPNISTAFATQSFGTSPYAYQTPASFSTASIPAPAYDTAPTRSPVPDARYLDVPNSSSNSSSSDFDTTPAQPIPRRAEPTSFADDISPRVSSAAGRFTGVPSAAAVWRATSTR
jgi:hypothetical protein